MIKYDPFLQLGQAIVEVLQGSGPAKPKAIKKHLKQQGWGDPPVNAINKALTQYLNERVEHHADGSWSLKIQDGSPIVKDGTGSLPKIENEGHGKPHILFVCARNRWRSPTAERLYRNDERMDVRSAGLSEKSPHPISQADIRWADLILVMEEDQKSWITGKYRNIKLPGIASLDIPDEYEYMEKELIDLIRGGVEHHINGFANHGI